MSGRPRKEVVVQHPVVALAAVVGQPVAHVQSKTGARIDVDELLDVVRRRTPERAALPVRL
jgi:fatty-acyl-CoA synthase